MCVAVASLSSAISCCQRFSLGRCCPPRHHCEWCWPLSLAFLCAEAIGWQPLCWHFACCLSNGPTVVFAYHFQVCDGRPATVWPLLPHAGGGIRGCPQCHAGANFLHKWSQFVKNFMKIGSILQLNGSARKTSELISACHLLCQLAIRKAASLKTSSVDCADCNALKNIATAENRKCGLCGNCASMWRKLMFWRLKRASFQCLHTRLLHKRFDTLNTSALSTRQSFPKVSLLMMNECCAVHANSQVCRRTCARAGSAVLFFEACQKQNPNRVVPCEKHQQHGFNTWRGCVGYHMTEGPLAQRRCLAT